MKLSLMGRVYPLAMDKLLKKQLLRKFDKTYIENVLKKANLNYKQILKRTPDMGGKENIFIKNIYMGSYIIAVYKAAKREIDLPELNRIIVDGLNEFALLKKKMSRTDLSSDAYRGKLKKAAAWAYQNRNKYPGTWLLSVPDHVKPDGVYYEFTQCGLCTLCEQEGEPDLIHLLCNTDYITIGFSGCKLTRTKTLAKGDSCCNFWIQRK